MSEFETKDSGERHEFASGMVRDSQDDKPRFDLISPLSVPYEEQMLTRLARLMGRGAAKYGDRNWEKGNSAEELARAKSSALRHFMQWFYGERDEDHACAVFFNLIAAEYFASQLTEPTNPRLHGSYYDPAAVRVAAKGGKDT